MTNLLPFYNWNDYMLNLGQEIAISALTNDHFWPLVTSNECENSVSVFRMSNYLDLIPHMTHLLPF